MVAWIPTLVFGVFVVVVAIVIFSLWLDGNADD